MSNEKLTNAQLSTELRKLAQLYEENEGIAPIYEGGDGGTLLIFCHDKDTFASTVRAFTEAYGGGEKADGGDTLDFTPNSPLKMKIMGFKNGICERVAVGKKLIPEAVIPARPASEEYVIPEHEEEVYEWKCRPFLEGEERGGEA